MAFAIAKTVHSERMPAAGGVLVLVQSWEEVDFSSLKSIAGRGVTEARDFVSISAALGRHEVVVLRADDQAEANSGFAGLNSIALRLLAAEIDFVFLPAVAEPKTCVLFIGTPISRAEAMVEGIRRAFYDLIDEAFQSRPDLDLHLGEAAIRGLKKSWFTPVFIDGFQGDRPLKGGMLLAAAWEMAEWLQGAAPGQRIGIVLPPGLGAAVANLACVLVDKVPVNLNFTAGRSLNERAMARAEITTLITAAAMQDKIKDFPWPQGTVDLKELLTSFPKWRILLRWILAFILPVNLLRALIGVPTKGGEREAVLLFTSGSSGDPKGVVLTHRNVLGNIAQTNAVLARVPIKSILACLPIFHSFGSTVTFWWPILGGPQGVTYVSPTETTKLIELIARHQVGLFVTTPTFLKNFLRKADPAQLSSVRLIVTGAERLPPELNAAFEQKFAIPVCAGYGMTEASPVVATNLVDFRLSRTDAAYESPRRALSVGRLIPGIGIRIRDPETGVDQPLNQTGMIWLKGVNLFPGYLGDPKRTTEVLRDGWYQTGDLGRIDDDGFLFIEGRLSRFSKMAGEMVPHGTIEEAIAVSFPELGDDFQPIVVGIEDAGKGEALVILSTHPLDLQTVRQRLAEKGLPNLWIPRHCKVIEAIPHFATGKVDIRKCQELAKG